MKIMHRDDSTLLNHKGILYKLALVVLLVVGGGNFAWAEELTINNSTTTGKLPFDAGLYNAAIPKGQFIIPSSSITALEGKKITAITFYGNSNTNRSFGGFSVYLKEVEYARFTTDNYESWSDMTSYYSGSLTFSSSTKTMEIELNYIYNGGNLLIGFNQTSTGSFAYHNWYGETQTGDNNTALYTSDVNGTIVGVKFLPKITFTYEEVGGDPIVVAAPTELAASNITPVSADLSWTNGDDESTWQVSYSTTTGDHSTTTSDFTSKPYTLSGLTPSTTYYVSIRAKKGGTYSEWSNETSFTTANAVAVTGVTVSPTSWEMLAGETKELTATVAPAEATFKTVTWESSDTEVATVSSTGVVTAEGPGSATITVKSTSDPTKQATCAITVTAPVTPTAFKTKNLTSDYTYLTWTNGSSETTWQIKYGTTSGSLANTSNDINNNDKPYLITGLTSNTTYYASIRSKLGKAYSAWSDEISFTTPVVGPAPGGAIITTEDFESGWDTNASSVLQSVKTGWSFYTGYSGFKVGSDYSYSGNGLYAGYNSNHILIMPSVNVASNISFRACRATTSTTAASYVKLYKAIKVAGKFYLSTNPFVTVNMPNGTSISMSDIQEFTVSEGGYVAISVYNAAIDDLSYEACTTVSAITDNNGFTTFASSNMLDLTKANLPSGLEAYKARVDGNWVKFTEVNQTVSSNTGVLLVGAPYTEYRIGIAESGTVVEGNEFLVNSTDYTFAAENGYTYYAIKKNSDPLIFATFNPSSVAIPSNKAYLKVSDVQAHSLSCMFDDENSTTGVETMFNEQSETNSKIYNLQGQRVTAPQKGLYIVNGKKFINK